MLLNGKYLHNKKYNYLLQEVGGPRIPTSNVHYTPECDQGQVC